VACSPQRSWRTRGSTPCRSVIRGKKDIVDVFQSDSAITKVTRKYPKLSHRHQLGFPMMWRTCCADPDSWPQQLVELQQWVHVEAGIQHVVPCAYPSKQPNCKACAMAPSTRVVLGTGIPRPPPRHEVLHVNLCETNGVMHVHRLAYSEVAYLEVYCPPPNCECGWRAAPPPRLWTAAVFSVFCAGEGHVAERQQLPNQLGTVLLQLLVSHCQLLAPGSETLLVVIGIVSWLTGGRLLPLRLPVTRSARTY